MASNQASPVFLLACGRSGSTLLQRILNTHESLHIWGEHGGALKELSESFNYLMDQNVQELVTSTPPHCHQQVLASEPVFESQNWSVQWYNSFTPETIRAAYRGAVEAMFTRDIKPTAMYWGFKEIRYGILVAYFLSVLFENARFLLLVRDPRAVVRSQLEFFYIDKQDGRELDLTGGDLDGFAQEAMESVRRIQRICNSGITKRCLLLRYEDLLRDPDGTLAGITGFLGVSPLDRQKVSAILSEPKGESADKLKREKIDQWINDRVAAQSGIAPLLTELRSFFSYQD